jgi:hypothetical protein
MKQLLSYWKSRKDCFTEGPSALVDLFMVTLSLRQHQ